MRILHVVRWLFKIIGTHMIMYLVALFGSALLSGTRGGLFSYIYKNAFTAVDSQRIGCKIYLLVILLVIVAFIQRIFNFLFRYYTRYIEVRIRKAVFRRGIQGELCDIEKIKIHIESIVNNDIPTLEGMLNYEVGSLVHTGIIGMISLIIVFLLDYRLGITSVIINLMICFTNIRFIPRMRRNGGDLIKGQDELLKIASYTIDGSREIKMFSMGRRILCEFGKINVDNGRVLVDNSRVLGIMGGMDLILRILNFTGIMIIGLILSDGEDLSIGIIIGAMIQQDNIRFMFSNIGKFINKVQKSAIAAERVIRFLGE